MPRLSPGALVVSLSLLVATAVSVVSIGGCSEEPLPELAQVPSFALLDQDARPFGLAQLSGKVWVANFIFTHCPSICPLLTSQMGNLQRRAAGENLDVHFVSFSVDPRNDTPERLKAYAEEHGADLSNWSFLTGELEAVNAAIVRGMRVRMGEPTPSEEGGYDIMHASHFVLVDATGRIRGYYSSDAAGMGRILRDAARLR